MPISTNDIRDQSLQTSLRAALSGDGRISYPETVNLIQSTFDHGGVTNLERADLRRIMERSSSMDARSKRLIRTFLELSSGHSRETAGANKLMKYLLAMAQGARTTRNVAADRRIAAFMARSGACAFPRITRRSMGMGLYVNTRMPGLINQGTSSLCGPSSILHILCRDYPEFYCRFAIDLYERGQAMLGTRQIRAGSDLRAYEPPWSQVAPVDWVTAASIRDSENAVFDYDSVDDAFAGITLPNEMARWFRALGYTRVVNDTKLVGNEDLANAQRADRLFGRGYKVCLFIHGDMLSATKQTSGSTIPNHWVGLTTRMTLNTSNTTFGIFTWGRGDYRVPQGSALSRSDFLGNYFGFVAAKY